MVSLASREFTIICAVYGKYFNHQKRKISCFIPKSKVVGKSTADCGIHGVPLKAGTVRALILAAEGPETDYSVSSVKWA